MSKYISSLAKFYSYGIATGSTLTFSTNLAHNLASNYGYTYTDKHINEAQLNIYYNPVSFFLENIDKSFKFGLFWPFVPYVIYKNPREFYNIAGKYPPSWTVTGVHSMNYKTSFGRHWPKFN